MDLNNLLVGYCSALVALHNKAEPGTNVVNNTAVIKYAVREECLVSVDSDTVHSRTRWMLQRRRRPLCQERRLRGKEIYRIKGQ
jgi:hypothetical protein